MSLPRLLYISVKPWRKWGSEPWVHFSQQREQQVQRPWGQFEEQYRGQRIWGVRSYWWLHHWACGGIYKTSGFYSETGSHWRLSRSTQPDSYNWSIPFCHTFPSKPYSILRPLPLQVIGFLLSHVLPSLYFFLLAFLLIPRCFFISFCSFLLSYFSLLILDFFLLLTFSFYFLFNFHLFGHKLW